MSIKAFIFDMDGVLIDARDWHYEALNDALSMFGIKIPYTEHLNKYDGLPTRSKLSMLTREMGLPRVLYPLINSVKQERTHRIAAAKCFPQAQHLIMLAHLKRNGFKLGLATNSIQSTTLSMLKYAGIDSFFDVILTNEDVQEAKPSPSIYKLALLRLSVSGDETIVIEDNENGVKAAVDAGCRVVRVANPGEVNIELLLPLIKAEDQK